MASTIQKNLIEKNEQYASNFTEGHLALPPAKKYAVGRSPIRILVKVKYLFIEQ